MIDLMWTLNRKLKFVGVMPNDMEIPFFGAKFNINVRPEKGYIHPNGVKQIKSISLEQKKSLFLL